jgi:dTDP-4-dehydrorhamnose 3,5-epimerase
MIFTPTELDGAFVIDLERREDARGWFARTYCAREFEAHGLPTHMVQTNMSLTRKKGTLRGMHYQHAPHGEDKLVRCVRGAIWDCIVDLRPQSPTCCKWIGVELTEANGRSLLVPKGFAHGFVTLSDDAAVTYQVSEFYTPAAEGGARWDDPAFGIAWPVPVLDMSDKDRQWPAHAKEAQ